MGAKIKEPKIKTVHDVVNSKAVAGDAKAPTGNATPGTLKQGDELDVEDTVSIEDDVNALLGGEELSEEFKEKAKVIFEAALNSKVKEIQETLEVQYEAKLEEEKGELKVALQDRVDSYLEYVAEEWMVENTLAIEHGLKTEMTESFLSGMKGLF